jgi:hypothetical protein
VIIDNQNRSHAAPSSQRFGGATSGPAPMRRGARAE